MPFEKQLRFWGVRGSTPTPQAENLKFGGNTACVEIRTSPDHSVIFDAGTGIRNLGNALVAEANGAPIHSHIFLTHFHWDHIQGIPFFTPLYGGANHVSFHARRHDPALQETLEGQMAKPYFPVNFGQLAARQSFEEFDHGETQQVCGFTIHPFLLHHPQGATGYRIECGDSTIVYATDYEHGHPALDDILLEQAREADILICDTQYTPEEYELHRGWGHSTWKDATRLAREAGVGRLILFHHDPSHDDQTMERIAEDARAEFAETIAASETVPVLF